MSQPFDFAKALQELKSGKGLTGKDGILTPLIKQLTEAALQAELEQHHDTIKVLILEDDQFDILNYRRLFSSITGYAFELDFKTSAHAAIQSIENTIPDLIVADFRLPDMTGLEFIQNVGQVQNLNFLPVIMVTGNGNEEVAVESLKMGAKDYLVKESLNKNSLLRSIRNARKDAMLCQQLASKQEEMENFISRAAHDLRSPTCSLIGIVELLQMSYSDTTASQVLSKLNTLKEIANDALSLINTLAQYAQIGRNTQNFTSESLGTVVGKSLQSLEASIEQEDAKISVDSLPEIHGDPISLQQLFQNIIGNSLKYRKIDTPLEIGVSAMQIDNIVHVQVTDNGIGCPEEKLARIFEPLVRENSVAVSGYGIGLATCSKIVQQHQGKIWAQSAKGQGMTIHILLPTQLS